MSQSVIIGGLVLMMICCSSSSSAMFMMGGGDDSDSGSGSGSPGPSSPGPSGSSDPISSSDPTGSRGSLPIGRYVKLQQTVAYDNNATRDDDEPAEDDDKNKVINLAELEIFDTSGTNLTTDKTVSGSSEYPTPYKWSNLIDGDKTNTASTKGRVASEFDYMTVDLEEEKEIKKLVITNRTTCCKNRAIGIQALILADDGTTTIRMSPVITTTADTYTLTFPENTWS
jgi:hypothetical protein